MLTSEQGLFHEALNMAAIWRLPVLFVCENNQVPLAITPLPAASTRWGPATVGTHPATVCTQVGLSTDIKAVLASDDLGSVLPRAQGYGEALPADRHVT